MASLEQINYQPHRAEISDGSLQWAPLKRKPIKNLPQIVWEDNSTWAEANLWASCVDVDPVAAMMAYVQLSLLHIPAEVVVGNSLSMKFTKVMRTPAHYLGLWDSKLCRYWSNDEAQNAVIVEDAPTAVPQPMVVIDKGQMSLFDMSA